MGRWLAGGWLAGRPPWARRRPAAGMYLALYLAPRVGCALMRHRACACAPACRAAPLSCQSPGPAAPPAAARAEGAPDPPIFLQHSVQRSQPCPRGCRRMRGTGADCPQASSKQRWDAAGGCWMFAPSRGEGPGECDSGGRGARPSVLRGTAAGVHGFTGGHR